LSAKFEQDDFVVILWACPHTHKKNNFPYN